MANRSLQSASLQITMSGTVRNVMDDGQQASGSLSANYTTTYESNVDANGANRAWQWKHTAANPKTLSSGASIEIDLYDLASMDMGAGDGNDIVGQALVNEEIVAILIVNENAVGVAGELEVEPGDANGIAWIGSHTTGAGALRGRGKLLKEQPAEAGFAITDGANHTIKLSAVGGDVNYSIYLFGRNDDEASSSSSSQSSSQSSSSSSSSSSSVSSSSSSSLSSSSVSSSSSSSLNSSSSSSSSSSNSSSSSLNSSSSSSSQSA